jgi:hypothetical protein
MTKELFLEELKKLNEQENTGLQLFFLLNNGEIKKVDLDNDLLSSLKINFTNKVNETFNSNRHFTLKNILEMGDESLVSEYFYFDNEDIHQELEFILEFTNDNDDIDKFVMTEDKYKNIKAILLKIGTSSNNIILYKHHYPINVLKKMSTVNIFKSGDTFKEVSDDIFKIDINFDLLMIGEHIVVNKMNTLESKLGYSDRIISMASNHLEVITALNFIEDMEFLKNAIKQIRWAKKLNKVQSSPVLNIIQAEKDKVISFIKGHPSLCSININSSNKLKLNSQRSVERFLKLLDDDYLYSKLTETQYDTNAKNSL